MANTRGTRQHYLPACIIGRFSDRTSGALRKRTVYVMRRGQKEIFTQKAEALWGADVFLNGHVTCLRLFLYCTGFASPVTF